MAPKPVQRKRSLPVLTLAHHQVQNSRVHQRLYQMPVRATEVAKATACTAKTRARTGKAKALCIRMMETRIVGEATTAAMVEVLAAMEFLEAFAPCIPSTQVVVRTLTRVAMSKRTPLEMALLDLTPVKHRLRYVASAIESYTLSFSDSVVMHSIRFPS